MSFSGISRVSEILGRPSGDVTADGIYSRDFECSDLETFRSEGFRGCSGNVVASGP